MNSLFTTLVILIAVPYISGTISDLRLCGDPECRVPLSRGTASIRYQSIDPLVLSFNSGDDVVIFSKEAGSNKDLWGAEIRGQRGYIPKRLIREMQVYVRNPSHQVPTELIIPSSVVHQGNSQSMFMPHQQQPQPSLQHPLHMNPHQYRNGPLPNQPTMGMVPNGNTNIPQKKPAPTTTTTTTSTETPETTTENAEETTEAENDEIAQPLTSENVELEPKRDSENVADFDVKDNDTFVDSDGDFKNSSEDGDEDEPDDGENPDEEDDEEDVDETQSGSPSDETVAVPVSDDVQDMAIETVQQFLDSAATEATSNDTPAKPANLDALELPSLEPDSTISSLEQDSTLPVVLLQSVAAPKEAESSSTQDLSDKMQPAEKSDEVVTENPEHEETNDQLPKSDDVVMVNENLQEMSSNGVATEEVSGTRKLVRIIEAPGDVKVATEELPTEVEASVDEEQVEIASYLLRSNESASDAHALPTDVSVEAQSAPDSNEALEPPQATRMSGETAESEQSPTTEAINDNPATDSVTDAAEKNDPLSVVESSYSTPVQEEDPAVATPANDQLLPTTAETREQPKESVQGDAPSKAGAEGSLFDKALSWLGLSESEEALQVQKTVTTPSPLQEQIASMDPNSYRADQLHDEVPLPDAADSLFDVTTPSSNPVDGFCHKDDELCRKAQDQVVDTDGSSSHGGHSHGVHEDHHHDHDDDHNHDIWHKQEHEKEGHENHHPSGQGNPQLEEGINSAPQTRDHIEDVHNHDTKVEQDPVEVKPRVPETIQDHSSHEKFAPVESEHAHSEQDHSAQEHAAQEQSESDNAAHLHTEQDHSSHDHSSHDHSSHDHSSHDHSSHDHSAEVHVHQDNSGYVHTDEVHSADTHAGHDHHEHVETSHPSNNHLNQAHSGHSHSHHGHGHGHSHGHGHGHSHTPGYIPGFRHHYKPPQEQQQQVPPPSDPAVSEELPQSVEPVVPEGLAQSAEPAVPEGPPTPVPDAAAPAESEVYLSAEEIFRREEERRRMKMEAASSSQGEEGSSMDWLFAWLSNAVPGLHIDSEHGNSLVLTAIVGLVSVTLYFVNLLVHQCSRENALLVKISQLDQQLYESKAASEEFGTVQSKLSQQESKETELKTLNDQLLEEKTELEIEVGRLKLENESLEKELESVAESGLEAARMLNEVLASQGEDNQLQRSVEALQDQLSMQQLNMESLSSSLSLKTAENEQLMLEVEELRDTAEKYQVRLRTLQSDLETLKSSNRNYQQKLSLEEAELMELKQKSDEWMTERRSLTTQLSNATKESAELRDKVSLLSSSLKAKEGEQRVLSECLERFNQANNNSESNSGSAGPNSLELGALLEFGQLKAQLEAANQDIDQMKLQIKLQKDSLEKVTDEKQKLEIQLKEWQHAVETAVKDKQETEIRLEVLSNYFKEKEAQLQKELGTQEAKRVQTEETASETAKKMMATEGNVGLYKSQVDTLKKEIEEQERSYKSRLAAQEKRAHESWVASRQFERRLEEAKQEASQLRNRLIQVEKEKEAAVQAAQAVKENGTATNGAIAGPDAVEMLKPMAKRSMMGSVPVGEEVTILEHPPLLSPPGLPPAGLDLPHGGPPHPPFDALFPPPFMPPAPFMPPEHPGGLGMPPMYMPPMPPPPPSGLMADHRPPPLGMISSANFDVDFRRELSVEPPPRRYGRDSSPPKRYPSPGGSERSARSDRSDMNHYDDYYRPISPYGRHGGGRPRSVGRSRDPSPDRPHSYSPLPSPLYPLGSVHSPDDWEERSFRPHALMRAGSLRHPPGPKTSSPLTHPSTAESGDPHQQPQHRHRQLPPH